MRGEGGLLPMHHRNYFQIKMDKEGSIINFGEGQLILKTGRRSIREFWVYQAGYPDFSGREGGLSRQP